MRYLIVNSDRNLVCRRSELDDDFMANIDEIVTECEIIDLEENKFYRPCGWVDFE